MCSSLEEIAVSDSSRSIRGISIDYYSVIFYSFEEILLGLIFRVLKIFGDSEAV